MQKKKFPLKTCFSCHENTPLLQDDALQELLKEIPLWKMIIPKQKKMLGGTIPTTTTKIQRIFKFETFKQAMHFVNRVADLAESEGHHPIITITYNKVTLSLYTHAIGGLSKNDFVLAKKIDCL